MEEANGCDNGKNTIVTIAVNKQNRNLKKIGSDGVGRMSRPLRSRASRLDTIKTGGIYVHVSRDSTCARVSYEVPAVCRSHNFWKTSNNNDGLHIRDYNE